MSATINSTVVNPDTKNGSNEALGQGQPGRSIKHKNYKGFVAGVFSGIAKLSGELFFCCAVLLALTDQPSPSWTSVCFVPVLQLYVLNKVQF